MLPSDKIFEFLTLGAKFKPHVPSMPKDDGNNIYKADKIPNAKSLMEQIYIQRKYNKIHVYGNDIPKPIEMFNEIVKDPQLLNNLKKFGYNKPTPVQMQTLPLMLDRREVFICAPTGSGKTAAFLIPLLIYLKKHQKNRLRSIVISPTRELSKQTYLFCKTLITNTTIKPHLLPKITNMKCDKYKNDHINYDIIFTTPNRLNLLLDKSPPLIDLSTIEWLIIDESDKLFEIGFRDQLTKIYEACSSALAKRAMFSATYSKQLDDWCKDNLYDYATVCVGSRNIPTEMVQQELYFAGNEAGKILGLQQLVTKGWEPPVLIFVQSKDRAQQLYLQIKNEFLKVDAIHSDKPQIERDRIVREFREGKIWTMICTDLLSRGLDFKHVNLVINFDFPSTSIAYIHRIGRTGRAGEKGKAVTFFTHEDIPYIKPIYEIIKRSGNLQNSIPDYIANLQNPTKNLKKKLKQRAIIRPKVGSHKSYLPPTTNSNKKKSKFNKGESK